MTSYVRAYEHIRVATTPPLSRLTRAPFGLQEAFLRSLRKATASNGSLLKWRCTRRQQVTCNGGGVAYRCPTCSQPLRECDQGTLICDDGHTILRAREGHVHLRLSGRKAAVNAPGDSPEMVSTLRQPPRLWTITLWAQCL